MSCASEACPFNLKWNFKKFESAGWDVTKCRDGWDDCISWRLSSYSRGLDQNFNFVEDRKKKYKQKISSNAKPTLSVRTRLRTMFHKSWDMCSI
jgi:hypothetical protein